MANKDSLDKSLDLSKFDNPGGVSVGKLGFGLWVVSHRRDFFIGLIAVLILISAIFYGYSIYSYIDYFFFGGQSEKKALEQLTETPNLSEAQRAQTGVKKLVESLPQVISNAGKYDFLGRVNNPNNDFFASFNYCFVNDTVELSCGRTFILPGENKYLSSLSNDLKISPYGLRLVLKDVAWQRVDLHTYPNWKNFYETHIDFSVKNVQFKSSDTSGISEKLQLNVLEFDITNNTAYSYWSVPLTILLLNNKATIGVNRYTVENFGAGETKFIKIVWPDSLISHTDDIAVYPDLDIANSDIYKKIK